MSLSFYEFMYMFNIVACEDTLEQICFKLGIMLNILDSTVSFQFE